VTARAILSFSRDLEFATEPELAKRMGCSRHYWLRAAIKELIDNALDAGEEAGIEAPSILVNVESNRLTVADNGPGIVPELVERLCVRSERTSTREAYAAPDRGAQGNALQVLMALPFGFGLEEAGLTITSRGVEHTIRLRVNRLEQRVDLERTTREVTARPGTTGGIEWPGEIDLGQVERLINEHAWLNPHAEFRLEAESRTTTWDATAAVQKWTPGLPVPAHWYDLDRFAHRVLLEIKRDPEITVAQFLGSFRGLSSRTKCSEVAAVADLSYKPLAALLDQSGTDLDRGRAALLLSAMQEASRAPKHDVLGSVGKKSLENWARNHASNYGGDPKFLRTPP
jgi:DNA topoisomerase VI subunit B